MARVVTAFRYLNFDVVGAFQNAMLYFDQQSEAVQYQCAGRCTPWHGRWSEDDQCLKISFDAFAGSRGDDGLGLPRLKMSVLFRTRDEAATWQGYDYKGRTVHMVPLTQWTLDADGQSWTCTAEWSTESAEWIALESPS